MPVADFHDDRERIVRVAGGLAEHVLNAKGQTVVRPHRLYPAHVEGLEGVARVIELAGDVFQRETESERLRRLFAPGEHQRRLGVGEGPVLGDADRLVVHGVEEHVDLFEASGLEVEHTYRPCALGGRGVGVTLVVELSAGE